MLVSFNGGRTAWQTRQAPPPAGDVAAFAMTPGRLGAIAIAMVTPGLDTTYRSADLGRTWSAFGIRGTGGGALLSSVHRPSQLDLVTAACGSRYWPPSASACRSRRRSTAAAAETSRRDPPRGCASGGSMA